MPVASWVIVVWLSVLGAVLGSFFNVVVYRVPRGGSLIDPPSQCPKCKHPIRWRDNVPMLSWLLLRGRCRDCGIPISARYPIIEATCFLSFLTLAILECGLQGINLPAQSQSIESGMIVTLGWS
ncbi:MAG: prepilin peptidase [Patescibacteria group bacterium]|nr:prepilin peptidase [Patescibacteria group bacterium]